MLRARTQGARTDPMNKAAGDASRLWAEPRRTDGTGERLPLLHLLVPSKRGAGQLLEKLRTTPDIDWEESICMQPGVPLRAVDRERWLPGPRDAPVSWREAALFARGPEGESLLHHCLAEGAPRPLRMLARCAGAWEEPAQARGWSLTIRPMPPKPPSPHVTQTTTHTARTSSPLGPRSPSARPLLALCSPRLTPTPRPRSAPRRQLLTSGAGAIFDADERQQLATAVHEGPRWWRPAAAARVW